MIESNDQSGWYHAKHRGPYQTENREDQSDNYGTNFPKNEDTQLDEGDIE
ncbi:hypothetical protein J4218_02620 [Candidatus Pacearchaeota archaeon]|nr:hypothetical protein [Candidatus Pacearchaeota archaeon]